MTLTPLLPALATCPTHNQPGSSVEVLAEVLTSGDRGGERIRKARTLCGGAQGRSGMDASVIRSMHLST
ncbi:unnamed protein product [Lampetra fluviatilis]